MSDVSLSFIHRYEPPARADAPTLLLLHGTGGDENDLLPLGKNLMPDAGMLSPRGKVLEQGMPRFFRRLAEGVFDVEDLKRRTSELADFIAEAAEHYTFDARRVIAVGFSNGANIAASLLLSRPSVLSAAVLFRAMVPFVPEAPPASPGGASVLLSNGGCRSPRFRRGNRTARRPSSLGRGRRDGRSAASRPPSDAARCDPGAPVARVAQAG